MLGMIGPPEIGVSDGMRGMLEAGIFAGLFAFGLCYFMGLGLRLGDCWICRLFCGELMLSFDGLFFSVFSSSFAYASLFWMCLGFWPWFFKDFRLTLNKSSYKSFRRSSSVGMYFYSISLLTLIGTFSYLCFIRSNRPIFSWSSSTLMSGAAFILSTQPMREESLSASRFVSRFLLKRSASDIRLC